MTEHRALVQVQKKGQQLMLVTSGAISAGEILLQERPLISIALLPSYRYGDYCWDMVDMLLADPETLRRVNALKLEATEQLMDPLSLQVERILVDKYKKSRALVRQLYCLIGTNNIGLLSHSATVTGYGLFPLLSRANHSCVPTAELQPGEGAGVLMLRAKHDMKAGAEVTWSYFREAEFLPRSFEERNGALVNTFRFACWCPRCKAEWPAALAGVKDMVAHFDAEIAKEARELAKKPDGLQQAMSSSPLAIHRAALLK